LKGTHSYLAVSSSTALHMSSRRIKKEVLKREKGKGNEAVVAYQYVKPGEYGGSSDRLGAPAQEHRTPGVDDDGVVGDGDDGSDDSHHEVPEPTQPRAGAERVHVPAAVHPLRAVGGGWGMEARRMTTNCASVPARLLAEWG
jgi:hypothetical protein